MILFHVILPGIHFRKQILAVNGNDMRPTAVKKSGKKFKKKATEEVFHSVAVAVPDMTCGLYDV